jgi:hypothetical protein
MSLAQSNKVDLVTVLPGNPRVVLIAYDGGELLDSQAREQALQEKLIAYLQFFISGQFARTYSQFLDRDVCILVVCLQPPTAGMMKIKGIRDHVHPETFLPVEIITDAEFRTCLAKAAAPKPR